MSPDRVTLPPRRPSKRLTWVAALILVTLVGALMITGYSVYSVGQDRNGWREVAHDVQLQNDELRAEVAAGNTELACRSRANFNTVKATAEVIKVISKLVDASGQKLSIDDIRTQLGPAIAALDAAITAQDAAIPDSPDSPSTCTSPGG